MTNRPIRLTMLRERLPAASPWIFGAACTLLLFLLSFFTFSNYQREKELVAEALTQKGLTLMRFIDSSAREAMRDTFRFSLERDKWEEHLLAGMEQAAEQPGVEFVLLVDPTGKVLARAGSHAPEGALDAELLRLVGGLEQSQSQGHTSQIVSASGVGKRKFQLAAYHMPPDFMHHQGFRPGRGRMMNRLSQNPQFAVLQKELERMIALRPLFIVQLDYELFNTPLRRQLLQTVLLLTVLVLVAAGGWLSLITLRGLRGSQLRLGKVRAFNDIMVSSLPIGLIATDQHGLIQVCNSAAGKILGLAGEGIMARSPEDCLAPEIADLLQGNAQTSASHNPQPEPLEVRYRSPLGDIRILQLVPLSVEDNGQSAGKVLLIRDLTEVKNLEKELQRNERMAALGKMAAGVAHELRNPLSSIKGLATLLRKKFEAGTKEASTADILVREVDRLNRSIGELLDYAKPAQLSLERGAVEPIVSKTVSLIAMDASACGVSIDVRCAEDLAMVMVDVDKLNQVLLNLLLNGLQAMPEGGALVISAANNESKGGWVEIRVRDNGVGISPENLSKVFDPYFTSKNDGTGLGLSMSAKIVEEHGGRISIASSVGEYTEVKVELPVARKNV